MRIAVSVGWLWMAVLLLGACSLEFVYPPLPDRGVDADASPACLIDGERHAAGDVDPLDGCHLCDPELTPLWWSPARGCVLTLAGDGSPGGSSDGPARQARLHTPEGIVVDAAGRVLVADFDNHRIRAIHRGQVTTFAGAGMPGYADGPAAQALFSGPRALAIDAKGTVYVAEHGNHRIRAITGGQVTTVAGQGAGFLDGPAASARFKNPNGVAVDDAGRLYVTEYGSCRVRMIADGQVSTLVGDDCRYQDGALSGARFKSGCGVAATPPGWLFVSDCLDHRVRLVSNGVVSTVAGTGVKGLKDGPGGVALLSHPEQPAVGKAGQLYVPECDNATIRLVADGQVSTVAGDGSPGFADGPAAKSRFSCPGAVAVDGRGLLYVADTGGQRVRVIRP